MKADVFFSGGGEMGELIRSFDWSKTPLGSPEQWPQTLKWHTKTMLDNKLGMYIAWGPEYIQIYNDGYRPILGSSKHPHALGVSTRETFSEIWDIIGPMFMEVMEGKSLGFPDFMLPLDRNGDGKIEDCFFDFSYSPIYHEDGYVGGVLVNVIETTEKVLSLRKLNQSESNLQNLVLHAPVGMCVLKGKEYVVEVANDAMLHLWGTRKEIVMGKPVFEAIPVGKGQGIEQHLDGVYNTGISYSGRNSLMANRDGKLQKVYVNYSYDPFRDEDGNITGIIAVAIDVTQQVVSKKEIEESEANLQRLVMNAPVAMCVLKEPDDKVEIANDRMIELWGTTIETVMKRPIFEAIPEGKGQGLEELLDSVYKSGISVSAQEHPVVLTRNGKLETLYVNFSYDAFRDSKGEITGIVAVAVDVTKQVEAKKEIEESEQRFRALVNATSDVIYILSADWSILNPLDGRGFLRDTDKQITDWKPRNIHPDDMEKVNRAVETAIHNKQTFELEHKVWRVDGTPGWTLSRAVPIFNENGEIKEWVGMASDITERKMIELALEDSREKSEQQKRLYETITSGTPDLMYVFDLNYRFTYANKALLTMWGKSEEEAIGKSLLENGYEPWHAEMHEREIDKVKAEKKPIRGEVSFPHATLGTRIYDYIFAPIFNAQGEVEAIGGITRDITERKQDEIRKSDFIGMVSHELKTPLTSLKAIVQIADAKLKSSEDLFLAQAMSKANIQVQRMSTMINGFLNISRFESGKIHIEKTHFSINDLLREIVDEIKLSVTSHHIALEKCDPIVIYADRDKISSVVSNLLSNAVKYSPKQSIILVACKSYEQEIIISVMDEGFGIQPSDAAKIFDRYYRVESSNTQHISGFGIGLYLSAEIIQRHGGRIWLESEVGKGSTFFFSLPVNH